MDRALAERGAHDHRLGLLQRMETHFLLWRATGEGNELVAADSLLEELCAHAPAESRGDMLVQVPLNRDIVAGVGGASMTAAYVNAGVSGA